ncbi:hypothetical protein vBAmePPT11V19_00038 [Alteromonas phage vB_AmeP_PT11-V19]|nr:hypothetical protein vBAmePPT11V19_00038 [Alteromonas phage vB_AmeP_PT11-V19]
MNGFKKGDVVCGIKEGKNFTGVVLTAVNNKCQVRSADVGVRWFNSDLLSLAPVFKQGDVVTVDNEKFVKEKGMVTSIDKEFNYLYKVDLGKNTLPPVFYPHEMRLVEKDDGWI